MCLTCVGCVWKWLNTYSRPLVYGLVILDRDFLLCTCGLIGGDTDWSSVGLSLLSALWLCCSWLWGEDIIVEPIGGVIDVGGELSIVRFPVDRIIATGLAIGGSGGGGNIVLYCEYWDAGFGLLDRICCMCCAW